MVKFIYSNFSKIGNIQYKNTQIESLPDGESSFREVHSIEVQKDAVYIVQNVIAINFKPTQNYSIMGLAFGDLEAYVSIPEWANFNDTRIYKANSDTITISLRNLTGVTGQVGLLTKIVRII